MGPNRTLPVAFASGYQGFLGRLPPATQFTAHVQNPSCPGACCRLPHSMVAVAAYPAAGPGGTAPLAHRGARRLEAEEGEPQRTDSVATNPFQAYITIAHL